MCVCCNENEATAGRELCPRGGRDDLPRGGRADLLVQLMQFHRMAVNGGAEIEPTLQ